MTLYLCAAAAHEFFADEWLGDIAAHGWTGIRVDGQHATPEQCAQRVQQVTDAGLRCLLIVSDTNQLHHLPGGTEIEVRNEPDIGTNEQVSPGRYVDLASGCADLAGVLGLGRVWIGAVSNLNRRGLDYLSAVFGARVWPDHVGCTVHRYPHGGYDQSPLRAHDGFASR